MPVFALVVGTFGLWITSKGELGKYIKLATTKAAPTVSAPSPANSIPAAPGAAAGVTNTGTVGGWTLH